MQDGSLDTVSVLRLILVVASLKEEGCKVDDNENIAGSGIDVGSGGSSICTDFGFCDRF
jgi:hypothetical protein